MPQLITQVNNINEEWGNSLKDKWWSTSYQGDTEAIKAMYEDNMIEKLLKLRHRLLEYGGRECCLPYKDEDIDIILSRGELFIPEPINNKQRKYLVDYNECIGAPSQCHSNSAELYWNNKDNKRMEFDIKICTGYAITEDGMWRQHSWIGLIDPFSYEVDTIIETTLKRIAYYGVTMTTE